MRVNKAIKYITSKTVKPLAARYITTQRVYRHKGIGVTVPATVFHPGLFFSTKLLLRFISGMQVAGKTFLELGAGSGLIALHTAKRGAIVTASDINSKAVEYLHINAQANNVAIQVIASNLFAQIPLQQFDMIAINPPYFKKHPANAAEHAWYCGANHEYFHSLFETMEPFVSKDTAIYMILSEDCDIAAITHIAEQNHFTCSLALAKRVWWEKNYIFRISLAAQVNTKTATVCS